MAGTVEQNARHAGPAPAVGRPCFSTAPAWEVGRPWRLLGMGNSPVVNVPAPAAPRHGRSLAGRHRVGHGRGGGVKQAVMGRRNWGKVRTK